MWRETRPGLRVGHGELNQASAAIVDGTADAAVLTVHFRPRETRNIAAGAKTMWSMPKAKFESEKGRKLLNKPGSVATRRRCPSFRKRWERLDDRVRGRHLPRHGGYRRYFVNKSMAEDTAYQLTKAHIENLGEIKSLAPFMSTLNYGGDRPEGGRTLRPQSGEVPSRRRARLGRGRRYKIADCTVIAIKKLGGTLLPPDLFVVADKLQDAGCHGQASNKSGQAAPDVSPLIYWLAVALVVGALNDPAIPGWDELWKT